MRAVRDRSLTPPTPTGVLLSGGGTTLQNLIDRAGPDLPLDLRVVVGTKAGCYGLERARQAGIAAHEIPRKGATFDAFCAAIDAALDAAEVELVVMAGLIHKWRIPARYAGQVINVHPALIPAFSGKGYYGRRVHEAVAAAGVRLTGCTVHFCDDEYDHGPIILQRAVPVAYGDTPDAIQARVQAAEREALPEALALYAAGRLTVRADGVEILPPR